MNSNLWGIDLGGTKIEGVVFRDDNSLEELVRIRVPTEAHLGYQHILNQVKLLVDRMALHVDEKPKIIGFASPGTYIPSKKVMKNCNATVVNGKDLKSDLEKYLELKIILANDANCFTLAETELGVVKSQFPDASVVFGVILGTGVGGGLMVNGQLIYGNHGIGGEWGHNYLYPNEGKLCYCGKIGCVEQIISGPALERYHHEISGQFLGLREIYDRYQISHDHFAQLTIERLKRGFERALSSVINIVDPDLVVVGGGVSKIEEIYSSSEILKTLVFNHEFDTPIVKAQLGDSAGVFGAALLVKKYLESVPA